MRLDFLFGNIIAYRIILVVALILLATLLGVSFLGYFFFPLAWPGLGVMAALLLALVLRQGKVSSLAVGFLAGFFQELFTTLPLGSASLAAMAVVFFASYLIALSHKPNFFSIFLITILCLTLYTVLLFVILFVWGKLPSLVVYNLLFSRQLIYTLTGLALATALSWAIVSKFYRPPALLTFGKFNRL